MIGTMTLVLTVYALLVEHLNIKSAKDVRDKARELRAKAKAAAKKAKAAAKTAKAKLTGRGKKKPFFGIEDEDGDDGAVTAQVVTPSGDDEGASLLARKEGWLAAPAPAPAPLVREMPLQQEAQRLASSGNCGPRPRLKVRASPGAEAGDLRRRSDRDTRPRPPPGGLGEPRRPETRRRIPEQAAAGRARSPDAETDRAGTVAVGRRRKGRRT